MVTQYRSMDLKGFLMARHSASSSTSNTTPATQTHTSGNHTDSRTAKDTGYVGKHRVVDGKETQR